MDDGRGRSSDEGGRDEDGEGGGSADDEGGRSADAEWRSDDFDESRYTDDEPPPAWMRRLGEYGYVVAFVLFFLTVLSMREAPSSRGPVPRTMAGLTAGVLLYQTWFLVARTAAATDVGVLIPYGNGIDRLESEGWAFPLAFLSLLFAVLLVTQVVVA